MAEASRPHVGRPVGLFLGVAAIVAWVVGCAASPSLAPVDAPALPPSVEGVEPDAGEAATPETPPTAALDAAPGAVGIGDPYFPTLGNGGYDVDLYDLDLIWDPSTAALSGTATITAVAEQDLTAFNLDLGDMVVSSIRVDGRDATFAHIDRELTVDLPAAIAEGVAFVTEIAYAGFPEQIPGLSDIAISGWINDDGVSFVLSEPAGNYTWHPVNDHPRDKARFRISLNAPDDLTVAASGLLMATEPGGDGTTTWTYETRDPLVPYAIALAVGGLELVDAGRVGDVVIRHAFDADLIDQASRFDSVPQILTTLSELFGPFPFEAFGVLLVEPELGLALEQQTLSTFGADFLGLDIDLDVVIAHELAHQWFGDFISVESWKDVWLNEGFATYAEHLYLEASDPSYDIDAALGRIARFDPAFLSDPLIGDPGPDNLFSGAVYFRGGLTLHALRRTVGDDAFFEIIRRYVTDFGGGNASSADFEELAAEVSGQELGIFFEAWLRQPAVPELPLAG